MAKPHKYMAGGKPKAKPIPKPTGPAFNSAKATVQRTHEATRRLGLPASMRPNYGDKKSAEGRALRKKRAVEIRQANYYR